jgi:hypothetical protein
MHVLRVDVSTHMVNGVRTLYLIGLIEGKDGYVAGSGKCTVFGNRRSQPVTVFISSWSPPLL